MKIYFNWARIGVIALFTIPILLLVIWLTSWEGLLWGMK